MWRLRNNKIVRFIQRGKKGYDSTAHWSADNYLAGVIAGVLNDLADHSHGTPMLSAYIIDDSDPTNPEMDHELWINDIRYAAGVLKCYSDYQFDSPFDCPGEDEIAEVFGWLGKNWGGLWD